MAYYVWFNAEQGVENRYGYLQLTVRPTPDVMRQAIARTVSLDPKIGLDPDRPVILTWRELTQGEYERERAKDIRELGPATFTNADQKSKMN